MTEKEKGSLVRKVWPPGGFSSPFARVDASVSVYEAWITSLNPAGEKCQGPSFGQAGEKWQGASGRPLAKLSRGGYMEKVWGLPPPHITRDDWKVLEAASTCQSVFWRVTEAPEAS